MAEIPNKHEQIFDHHQANGENIYIERRPIPDPTQLTTFAIARDINSLRDVIMTELEGYKKIVQATIEGHWSLDTERFKTVELRFSERDLRFNQAALDNAEAIKSALTDVNSATTRLENTFGKQIDGLSDRLLDLKDRITAIEGNRKGSESVIGWVIGSSGVVMGIIIAVITGIFSFLHYLPTTH